MRKTLTEEVDEAIRNEKDPKKKKALELKKMELASWQSSAHPYPDTVEKDRRDFDEFNNNSSKKIG